VLDELSGPIGELGIIASGTGGLKLNLTRSGLIVNRINQAPMARKRPIRALFIFSFPSLFPLMASVDMY
jgi:hypothetical protein